MNGERCLWILVVFLFIGSPSAMCEEDAEIKVGIIGLDTSHVTAFTKAINADPADPAMMGCRVVAAYPHGSKTIESSYSRIPRFTKEISAMGVEIVDSIEQLLSKVDCVLLETNDGSLHLDQALQVFRSGKPVFIDKPAGSNLAEVVAIYRAATHFGVPMFSSSSLRYSEGAQAIRNGKLGRVLACDSYSPASIEPSHVDLYWYGIHGVETLFTCMGRGCVSVQHTSTQNQELAVGVWSDGRVGTFRGMREGKSGYGGTAYGDQATGPIGPYGGYRPLVEQITKFFRSKKVPIDPEETIELYAFMQAAAESKRRGGASVTLAEVMKVAETEASQLWNGK